MQPIDRTLVEVRWRIGGPSASILVCGIYQDGGGVNVRAAFENGETLRTRAAANIEEARLLADEWLDVICEDGRFEKIPKAT